MPVGTSEAFTFTFVFLFRRSARKLWMCLILLLCVRFAYYRKVSFCKNQFAPQNSIVKYPSHLTGRTIALGVKELIGRFSNRTGTSVDNGARKSNNWLDQWQSGKLGTGSRV